MRVRHIIDVKGSDVITVSPQTLIADVVRILAENRIGGVVVTSSGADVAGILSERDIVRALNDRGAAILDEQASTLMTADPVCATLDDVADAVLQSMTEGRFRHMPIMNGDKLVGIVTIGDVVKARIDELAEDNDAMQQIILGGAS